MPSPLAWTVMLWSPSMRAVCLAFMVPCPRGERECMAGDGREGSGKAPGPSRGEDPVKLMRLSYSQETLVRGCREPAAPALLEQPRQMPSAAQVQARADPGQGQGGLGAQFPG